MPSVILHRLVTTISGAQARAGLAGAVKYDPENGFDLNRRQFASAWNQQDGSLLLTTWEIWMI